MYLTTLLPRQPEYVKAAAALKDFAPKVVLAKVDATAATASADRDATTSSTASRSTSSGATSASAGATATSSSAGAPSTRRRWDATSPDAGAKAAQCAVRSCRDAALRVR